MDLVDFISARAAPILSSLSNTPAWVASLVGVVLGFGLYGTRDLWRNRRRLRIDLAGGLILYARPVQAEGDVLAAQPWQVEKEKLWYACRHDHADAYLVLRLDLRAVNRSFLDDAVTEAALPFGKLKPQVALVPGYTYFYGCNIRAHSLEHIRLIFTFARADYGHDSHWMFTAQKEPLNLQLKTTRRRSLVAVNIKPVEDMQPVFPDGEQVTDWVKGTA